MILKRIFDFSISLFLLIIMSPFFLLIAIFIKMESPGPVFFRQTRLGQNGKNFKVLKFRTMVENAQTKGTGIFVSGNDSRITKTGKLLRNYSIDELPQLINVIKGEMSLVGPRPPVLFHPRKFEDYSKEQKERFLVKPGITGLAQVKGRNVLTWDERIKLDIHYVRNRDFWFDLKIIFMTFSVVFSKKNLYRG